MGLYDYLGDDQVKCFGRPSVGINPNKDGTFNLFIHCAGGDLRGYPRGSLVPYKTPFYNYGKDFMVFDYRTFNYEEPIIDDELWVHIVKNGRYFRSVRYDKIHSKFDIPLVLDNYGEAINIKSHTDFKKIVNDWRESHIKYEELSKKYRDEMGIPDMLRMNRFDLEKYSNEEITDFLEKNKQCMERATEEGLKPFSDTWYGPTKELNDKMNEGWPFGALYYSLENYTISEFDKYWIARLFITRVEEKSNSLMLSLGEYFNWCLENDINVDKLKFMRFFSKYSRDIPQEIVDEYQNSEEKAFRDKVYGISK